MIDNKFELTKILGKGGSSKVFLAHDCEGNRVALKAIRKDKKYSQAAASAMVEREHEMLQKLEGHPNVIRSFGVNLDGVLSANEQTENIMYSVIELAKNGALSNFVRYTGGIEEEIARLYAHQI